jgi:hypothetical protein
MSKRIRRPLAVLMVSGLLVALAAGAALAAIVSCPSGGGNCYGTPYPDTIYGSNYRDIIYAYRGGDLAYGYGGNDDIYPGKGSDTAYGHRGNDSIVLPLNSGGYDYGYGGYGNDYIDYWDSDPYDSVYCGPGYDTVHVDSGDYYSGDCENPTVH